MRKSSCHLVETMSSKCTACGLNGLSHNRTTDLQKVTCKNCLHHAKRLPVESDAVKENMVDAVKMALNWFNVNTGKSNVPILPADEIIFFLEEAVKMYEETK